MTRRRNIYCAIADNLNIQAARKCTLRKAGYALAHCRIAEAVEGGGTRSYFRE